MLWNVHIEPMHQVTQNPPLAIYYLALASTLTGWGERGLHAACLLPALGVVLGTWRLGRHLCQRPVLAAMGVLCTPVFLISSTNVMCDTLMTSLWVWSVVLWLEGMNRNSQGRLAAAALLAGTAALTKYFAISLLPLLALYAIIRTRRLPLGILWLAIPIAMLAIYEIGTEHLYGHGLLTGAVAYARKTYLEKGRPITTKWFGTLAFAGACLPSLLLYSPWLAKRGRRAWVLLAVVILMAATAVAIMLWSPGFLHPARKRPTSWDLAGQAGTLLILGVAAIGLTITDLWSSAQEETRQSEHTASALKWANSLLLSSWVIGTVIFTGHFNWTINGRSVLPMVPALSILLCRRLDQSLVITPPSSRQWWPLLPCAALTLVVTHADYRFAWAQRQAAETLARVDLEPHAQIWFTGHWGFQFYMQQLGGVCVRIPNPPLEAGDLFVLPENNDVRILPPPQCDLINVFPFEISRWASTHQPARCTGFYSDGWGALPFVVGPELQSDPQYMPALRKNNDDVYRLERVLQRTETLPVIGIRRGGSPSTAPGGTE
jgi:hypothetical protein